MQVGQFPASAANSLIEGYCDDFVSLAAILAQTLEQVAMRGIGLDSSRTSLQRIEKGMRELSDAIHELLERGSLTTRFENVLSRNDAPAAKAGATAPALPTHPAPQQPAAVPVAASSPSRNALQRSATRIGDEQPAPRPRPTVIGTPQSAKSTSPVAAKPPAATPPTAPPAAPAPNAANTRTQASAPAPTPTTTNGKTPTTADPPAPPAAAPEADAAPNQARRAGKPEGLRGTNRTMPLQSVFQFLGRTRKSGTLHVFVEDEILAFEFVNGCIEFTATNRCPVSERLGELLVELGSCTREKLAPVLAKVGVSSANRLGQLVVEEHIVSNGQVLEALETQVQRRFKRVCEAGEASYEFEAGRRLPGDGRIRIAPFELTIDQPWKLRTP